MQDIFYYENNMLELYKELYLDYLGESVVPDHRDVTSGTRPRVRKIMTWKNFETKLKHKTEIDLNQAIDVGLKDGPQVWVWSDQHFGHKNIIGFSDRPYPNLELMHECMILNHNDYVQPGDISIWVGDVAFLNDADANELVRRCNGYKILIIGNHDIKGNKVKNLDFDEMHLLKHVNIEYGHKKRYEFVFVHYPATNFGENTFVIHGHEHIAHQYTNTQQHINVNCEMHNFKPLNMTQILEYARIRRERQT